MKSESIVDRDERTEAIENAGIRLAYNILTFALLIDVACRAWFKNEAAWDLMAMVVIGGIIIAIYQARQKALPKFLTAKTALVLGIVALLAAIIAAAITLMG